MNQMDKAIQLVEEGQVSEGLRLLDKAEKDADDETKFALAQQYSQWGHVKKAKALAGELLKQYPDAGELYLFMAELLIDLDQEEEAIEKLLDVQENDPDYPRALLLLADVYSAQGLDEVAEQKLLEAKALLPDEPVVSFGLGEFYMSLGDFKKSVRFYREVLSHDPKLAGENIHLRLAEALSGSGQFEESLEFYEKGLENTVELHALFGYGLTAYRVGAYKKAIKAFQELKDLDPEYSTLYLYLARAYEAEGAFPEALEMISEGIKVDSFNEEFVYFAGELLLKEGQIDEAENYFRKTLKLNPGHHQALKNLAGLLEKQGKNDEVIELLSTVQEEREPIFSWFLASAYRDEEEYDQALKNYREAYTTFDNDPDFLEEYGDFLLEEGRREEAITAYRRALGINPSLIHLEERIGQFEEEF
jgi:tetratricopeptide (TPR) repeat protein